MGNIAGLTFPTVTLCLARESVSFPLAEGNARTKRPKENVQKQQSSTVSDKEHNGLTFSSPKDDIHVKQVMHISDFLSEIGLNADWHTDVFRC